MNTHLHKSFKQLFTWPLTFSLILAGLPARAQQAPKIAQPRQSQPAQKSAQPAASALVQTPGWPRELDRDGNMLVYYEPQVDAWNDYHDLTADMAFSLTPKGGKQELGVASLHGATIADVATRTVVIRDITLTSIRFPSLDQSASDTLRTLLRESFPSRALTINLDLLLAQIDAKTAAAEHPVAVSLDPPPIFVSTSPAILLFVDGKPVEVPIEGTNLKYVANANWLLLAADSGYFFLTDRTWLTAKDLKGPWEVTQQLPPDLNKLPAGNNWDDVRQALPPAPGVKTHVFFTDKPAELLLFYNSPVYEDIPPTKLLYVTNTTNNVFKLSNTQEFYVLLSGRWFRARALEGPWAYAGNDLPPDFKQIPPKSRC